MKLKRRDFYLEFIIGIIAIYVSVLILLFIFQRSLMYHPLENNYSGDRMEVEVEKVILLAVALAAGLLMAFVWAISMRAFVAS
jgi:hypothetical protein